MGFSYERLVRSITKEINAILAEESGAMQLPPLTTARFVKLTKDLSNANVQVGSGLDHSHNQACAEALNNHAGRIRHMLARRLNMRRTPQLHFHPDTVDSEFQRIKGLLDGLEDDGAAGGGPSGG